MIESSVYVGDLRAHIGSRRDIHILVPGESFSSSLVNVIDEVTCDLTLESVSHGIVFHGTLSGNFSAQCSYGLVDIVDTFNVNVNELFEEIRPREPITNDEETYRFQGDDIDIEQMLRDSIIPSLPLAPVCSHGPENCAVCSSQIAPFLAKDLEKISDDIIGGIDDVVSEPKIDPRWAELDKFPKDS